MPPPGDAVPAAPAWLNALGPRVLLVGSEPSALRACVQPLGAAVCEEAESFVEAILLLGQDSPFDLIVGFVEDEAPQLQRALMHVRGAHPAGKIILVCESYHEPVCRRALAWGANDYLIAPVTAAGLAAAAGLTMPSADRPPPDAIDAFDEHSLGSEDFAAATHAALENAADDPAVLNIDLLTLPLVVQAGLFNDLLQGKANLPDKAMRALQTHTQLNGELRFLLPTEAAALLQTPRTAGHIVAPVAHEGLSFGALELVGHANGPAAAAQLDQAAAWLGGFLAMVKRHEQLRTMAVTDELSGAYNRRYFTQWMHALLERAREGRFRVTLLLFDIDNFKSYNDRFGHAAGDAIIREVISLLRHCTRTNDLVARIGGDEFAVVFWDSEAPRQPNSQHPRDVLAVTDRFRKAIASHEWSRVVSAPGSVSISGGLSTFPWDGETLETLMLVADETLMQAKASGKNVILLSPRVRQNALEAFGQCAETAPQASTEPSSDPVLPPEPPPQ